MNLATLTQVKTYMQWDANMDPFVTALLPRVSDHVRRWLSRALPLQVITNRRLNGSGSSRLLLPEYPIISVERVSIDPSGATDLEVSDGIQQGYLVDEQMILLVGGVLFPAGFLNIICSWTAGYVGSETGEVPTGNSPTLVPSTSEADPGTVTAAVDRGVTYAANGAALVSVAANPGAGQYVFTADSGSYLFNTGDANAPVTMSYAYVPSTVVQAVSELIGLKSRQRKNLGIRSQSIADESVTFDDRDMTDSIRVQLQGYRRVVPV